MCLLVELILTGDRFYPKAENLLSILILQFVLFMHVYHLFFVSNDNNKDVQSIINKLFISHHYSMNPECNVHRCNLR